MTDTKKKALYNIGSWLSAALDDPAVCKEMKHDINIFFEAFEDDINDVVIVDGKVWD